jgi:OOP family OmpA-OmpF porin
MKRSLIVIFVLLLGGIAAAQEMELQVELMGPLGTQTSHKGDRLFARVMSPEGFKGDLTEGRVTEARSGGKLHGTSTLNFTFETLQHAGQAVPISTQVRTVANSKGQMDVDEEGRVIRKSSNVGKALGGTAIGGLIGGLAGGAKGAAIGAGAGAAASIILIEVAAEGPSIRFDPGSRVILSAKSRSGPALSSLQPNAAPAASPVPTSAVAADQPAAPAASSAPADAPAATTAAGAPAQPDLTTVKADFIPGEKTIFFDDFTDMAGDEPPPHWKIRGGTAELRVGAGIRQLTLRGQRVNLVPALTGLPPNFTYETEVLYSNHGGTIEWGFFDKGSKKVMSFYTSRVYGNLAVELKVGDEKLIGQQFKTDFSQPVKQNLWCQNGRLRLYLNGQRIVDVNQVKLPEMGTPRLETQVVNDPEKEYIAFRIARFAESTPDFSQTISSSGRYVTHGIHFDTDSDRLQPDSAPVIKSIAAGLQKNLDLKLRIEGHTDSTGNAGHNLDLSKRRAEAVKAVLVSQFAVDANRLTTDGLGASKPMDSNDTPQGRAQNRRVEFVRQ